MIKIQQFFVQPKAFEPLMLETGNSEHGHKGVQLALLEKSI